MKYLIYGHKSTATLAVALWRLIRGAWARLRPQTDEGPHRLSGRRGFGRRAAPALLLLGAVCQLVLLVLVGQLVELCIDLMEVWAELARKHLEITLSV